MRICSKFLSYMSKKRSFGSESLKIKILKASTADLAPLQHSAHPGVGSEVIAFPSKFSITTSDVHVIFHSCFMWLFMTICLKQQEVTYISTSPVPWTSRSKSGRRWRLLSKATSFGQCCRTSRWYLGKNRKNCWSHHCTPRSWSWCWNFEPLRLKLWHRTNWTRLRAVLHNTCSANMCKSYLND